MEPQLILAIGGLLTAWIMLSLIGSERHRKVLEFEATRPPEPSAEPMKDAANVPAPAATI